MALVTIVVFLALFAVFTFLGFSAAYWRKGDLSDLGQWALAGRKLGPYLAWFLVGGDLYTAYTFIAVPSATYGKGSIYAFATPYVMVTFAIAMVTMVTLWKLSRRKHYITGVDFVKERFNSKTLAVAIAATGIIAELPYIALQIVGMRAVLIVMLQPYFPSNLTGTSEIALIISFIVLAVFTFVSGLRGAALTAVMKDLIILITVVVVVIWVPMHIVGGFPAAFAAAHAATGKTYATLPPSLTNAYISLFMLSALTLYFYPHAINGVLSSKNAKTVRFSTAMLPLYGMGLFLLTLFGVLVFAVPNALAIVHPAGAAANGTLVVPALIETTMPSWFTGVAFLGIFIGGLVPAAVMAISQANLLTRNIIKEFVPNLKPRTETTIVKWTSVMFKFLALAFVFVVSDTYAIELQLLGGIFIAQTLPAMMLGLYDKKFLNKWALFAGWLVGMAAGIWYTLVANHFKTLSTSLYKAPEPFGLLYIAAISLAINLVVTYIGSAIARAVAPRPTATPAS